MDKTTFLQNLEKGAVAAAQNREELGRLPENAFEEFDDDLPLTESNFSQDYFFRQISQLKNANFAKRRCNHIIDVKEQMQKMNLKGFEISEHDRQTEQLNQNIEKALSGYRADADFDAALQTGNVNQVRTLIKIGLNSEYLDAEEVALMAWYAQRRLAEVFEPYEEDTKFRKPFNEDQSAWNYDYFIAQQSPLNMNFALERVLHLVQVRDALRQQGGAEFQKLSAPSSAHTTVNKTQQNPNRQPENIRTASANTSTEQPSAGKDTADSLVKTVLIIGGGILALIALALAVLR